MTERSKKLIWIEYDFKAAVNSATQIFNEGGVFVYPTDTILGLGGNPFEKSALQRIIEIKGRDENQKFIFLIKDIELLKKYIILNNTNLLFLEKLWPASVSVILPLTKKYAEQLNMPTAAFRIPANKFCSALLSKINMPLISTSVNISGNNPINDENIIDKEFGDKIDAIFFSKQKANFTPSTLIDLTGSLPKLIREGFVKFDRILEKFYS